MMRLYCMCIRKKVFKKINNNNSLAYYTDPQFYFLSCVLFVKLIWICTTQYPNKLIFCLSVDHLEMDLC